jgi:lipid II:glycine glycyltransferase (peptidoglycan interpeptide bridge formation enzyme)
MIYYRRKNLTRIAEIWYNISEKPQKEVDIIRYKFVTKETPKAASFEQLYTILIDLSKSDEELLSLIRKNTRYEINRAREKDNIKCVTFFEEKEKNEEKISKYMDFYNAFAVSKNRSSITFSDLKQFYDNETICVRYAAKEENETEILTMHAYIISDNTARLHQSSSLFRTSGDSEYKNLVARANRLLHWDDILYFKNKGLALYDLGGWYGGQTLKEQLLINQFKESFGGEKKREYSYIVPVSIRGIIAILVHSAFSYLKNVLKNRKG